jgi:GNAT superfamily N-acetyltransferase
MTRRQVSTEMKHINSQLPASTLLELVVGSYLATPRQRRIGERRQVGAAACVHYDYYWGGEHMLADNFFVGLDDDLTAVLEAIRRYNPAAENQIFVPLIDTAVPEIMAGYGCEDKGPTYLMERPLAMSDQQMESAVPVHHVASPKDVGIFNGVWGGNLALMTDALNGPFRYYYTLDGEIAVAQGRSWRCRPNISWESHVYTDPNFQRRGYGTAIMTQIVQDNAHEGVKHSVLLATEAGRRLYRRVGYIDRMAIGCYKWRGKR